MENKQMPEIRFPRFSGDWELRSLFDLMEFSNGINAPKESYGIGRKMISVMDILADEPIIYEKIRSSVQVNNETEHKNKVENGDLVFVRSSETREEVGWAKAYQQKDYALFSGFSIRGKKKTDFDAKFIELSLNYANRKQIERKAGGSTRYNVSQSMLNSIEVLQPFIIEQKAIGIFFEKLDYSIILLKQELTTLKQTKQGFLQKMFPKKGETVPEVRFPGFTGEWKQRKLGEVAEIVGGGTPSTGNEEYWNGNIDWYSPVEIGEQVYVDSSQKKITLIGLQKSSAKVLPIGTVLFTSRAGIGKTAILAKEGATNQGFQSILPHKDELDTYFIYARTKELQQYGEINGAGSTFVEVSGKQMAKMPILLPSLIEQIRIGNFFKQLDEIISLHQQELDALQETKKAFLQKIFV